MYQDFAKCMKKTGGKKIYLVCNFHGIDDEYESTRGSGKSRLKALEMKTVGEKCMVLFQKLCADPLPFPHLVKYIFMN